MKRTLLWVPLLAFAGLLVVVAIGLFRPADPTVRSALIGQSLPGFALPPMIAGKPGLTTADFGRGERRLLNVFASWCVPCIAEAPKLMALKKAGVPIDAIAIRDTDPAIRAFLARNGDPYERLGGDRDSRVQLALGSSGVPESFVIDGRGRIVLQHVGPIEDADVPRIIAEVKGTR
jgi:cytochrome c biogenesis protein CcmG/thiol:disulfide interchange protein DsbE